MEFIDKQNELDKIMDILSAESVLFVDTEFYRRETYYAKLCLIQISTLKQQYVIDPLANLKLTGFKDLMQNRKVIKVFHSADQDILIFYQMFGVVPKSIFDTQVAAAVCGLGKGIGYQRLCRMLLDIDVDKSMQKSDWQQRPLSKELIEYAITDIIYLIPLYDKLKNILRQRNLWQIYKQQISKILSEDTISFSPERIASRLRTSDLTDLQTYNLIELIAFREQCVKELNIPRNHFIEDKKLIEIACKLPKNSAELANFNLRKNLLNRNNYNEKLLSLCLGLQENQN